MKKTCDFLRVNKKIISAIAALLIVFLCVGAVFAAVTYISARGKIDMTTITLSAKSEFSYTEDTQNLTFTKPGDQKKIQVKTTNATASVLSCSYSLSLGEADKDSKLPQAILVYFNGEYKGTLQELTAANAPAISGAYVGAGNGTATDTITLELHLGAEKSLYNNQSVTLTTTAYTSTVDYGEKIFVSAPAELNKAIDDINSGLLPESTQIVLLGNKEKVEFGNVNTIQQPCTILLNGHTLSGTATLDGEEAYLNVIGNGTSANSATYTLTQYNETKVNELLLAAAKTALQDGVKGEEEADLFGHLKFYNPTVTVTGQSKVTNGTLTAASVSRSEVETLTVNGQSLEFTILDKVTGLAETYLKNIPNDKTTIVTGDLYLPTSIRSEGATIEWTSSNEGVMDSTGKITAAQADKEPVTLYATIRVNGSVTTQAFSFLVSAHTNEINFYKLVSTMSPVIIYEIANLDAKDETGASAPTGLYQLPIVDNTEAYDYRKLYETPTVKTSAQTPDAEGKILNYKWPGYQDIFLTELSYDILKTTTEDGTEAEIYPYIALDGSQLYLKQDTLNTYAEIKVTGTFETGEKYESRVRIIIATGTDTGILDEAFNHAQQSLQEVNILKNILQSRVESGMKDEKGDFTLPASYTAANGNTYSIKYESSVGVVTGITGPTEITNEQGKKESVYTVSVNPTHFSDIESRVAMTVTVSFGETSRTRNLYFTVPAAIHTADLGNATLFNTAKYQVLMQLPEDEKKGDTGFKEEGGEITNTTPDYILLRDILGDETYKRDYYTLSGDYLYEGAVSHAGCQELWFYTAGNDSSYTDTAARDLAALINWATGKDNTAETAGSVVINTTVLGAYASTLSNSKEYLTDDEANVIKTYYQTVTGKNDTDWNDLWNQVAERASGYIITDSAALDEVVKGYNVDTFLYFQYNEVLQWATNVRDNDWEPEHGQGVEGITFAPGNFKYDLISTTDPAAPTSSITVNETRKGTVPSTSSYEGNVTYTYFYTDFSGRKWYSHSATHTGGGAGRLKYSLSKENYKINSVTGGYTLDDQEYASYLDDDTSYISPAEAQVIIAYWAGVKSLNDAKKYIDALYKNMVCPTYFTAEGAQILLSSLYTDANIKVGKEGGFTTAAERGFTTAAVEATTETTGSKFAEQKVKVPAVVNLEDIGTGISYFSGLTGLYIKGSNSLPAFLSDYGLDSALSRITQVLPELTTLVMEHVADNYVSFDLTNIKNISKLTQVDVSDNEGITNVNRLVNYHSNNYTYVDFSHVNVSMEFQQYTLENVGSSSAREVYYSESKGGDRKLYEGKKSLNDALTYLDGLDTIIAENMFVATEVTDGTTTDTIYWRIESGNKITLVSSAGTPVTIDTISAMNYYISPYYYCESDFTHNGTNYYAGYVYRFMYDSASGVIREEGLPVERVDNVNQAAEAYNGVDNKTGTKIEDGTTDTSTVTNDTVLGQESFNNNSNTVSFQTYYRFYRSYTQWWTTYYNYLYDNNGTLAVSSTTSNTAPSNSLICYLTEDQYKIVTGQTNATEYITINNTNTGTYYIYFPETGRFLGALTSNSPTLYTLAEVKEDPTRAAMYEVSINSGNYRLRNSVDNRNYYIVSSNGTLSRSTNTNNAGWTRTDGNGAYSLTIYNALTITGGETAKVLDALTFGYDIMQIETVITQTKKSEVYKYTENNKYYFDGSSAYSVVYTWLQYGERSRERREYTKEVRLWYSTNGTDKIYLSGATALTNEITNIDINDISTDSYNIPSNIDWDINDTDWNNLTYVMEWHKQNPVISLYDSHVNIGTVADYMAKITQAQNGYYVQYTGNGNENVLSEGNSTATNYTQNSYYQMTVSGGVLAWTLVNESAGTVTGTGDMDSILATANDAFYTKEYGKYYGMYYAYNGRSITTNQGNTYLQYCIYRIMPNDTNTGFVFIPSGSFVDHITATEITEHIRDNAWGNNTENKDHVGEIFCIPTSGGDTADTYIKKGDFFTLAYNADSGSYALKAVLDVDGDFTNSNFVKFINCRSFAVLQDNDYSYNYTANDHTGTGGTYTVTISAFVRETDADGEFKKDENGKIIEYVRRYSVDVVG